MIPKELTFAFKENRNIVLMQLFSLEDLGRRLPVRSHGPFTNNTEMKRKNLKTTFRVCF